jgi:hypothetical protein
MSLIEQTKEHSGNGASELSASAETVAVSQHATDEPRVSVALRRLASAATEPAIPIAQALPVVAPSRPVLVEKTAPGEAAKAPRDVGRGIKLLPPVLPREPFIGRMIGLVFALAVAVGFFTLAMWSWSPVRPGVDENAYLVGGRMMADHLTTRFTPPDPFAFVSMMWVRTKEGNYYSKYPIGVSLLYAICLKVGGLFNRPGFGEKLVYLISPVTMTLGLLATFMLTRMAAGSLAGILAMLLVAASPATLELANNEMAHGPAICFVAWGIFFLLRWWQTDKPWRGFLAGFLLGFAVTIRYSEGLMVIPIALAMVLAIRWRRPKTILRTLIVPAGWILPVGLLALHNWCTIHKLTGYDTTNESTAFTWVGFRDKWELMLHHLYNYAMVFWLPLGVLGVVLLFRASWRFALIITCWFVPVAILYSAYYWGSDLLGIMYLRFFLSMFPAVALGAAFLVRSAATGGIVLARPGTTARGARVGSFAMQLVVSVLLAGSVVAIGLRASLPQLNREGKTYNNLAFTVDHILKYVPRNGGPGGRAVLFADGWISRFQLLDPLQLFTDADLYTTDIFEQGVFPKFNALGAPQTPGQGKPDPFQQDRRDYMEQVLKGKTPATLRESLRSIVRSALDENRPVFVLIHAESIRAFTRQYLEGTDLVARKLDAWKESPVTAPEADSRFAPKSLDRILGWPGAQSFELYQIDHGSGVLPTGAKPGLGISGAAKPAALPAKSPAPAPPANAPKTPPVAAAATPVPSSVTAHPGGITPAASGVSPSSAAQPTTRPAAAPATQPSRPH